MTGLILFFIFIVSIITLLIVYHYEHIINLTKVKINDKY
jgi:hypothetical protein